MGAEPLSTEGGPGLRTADSAEKSSSLRINTTPLADVVLSLSESSFGSMEIEAILSSSTEEEATKEAVVAPPAPTKECRDDSVGGLPPLAPKVTTRKEVRENDCAQEEKPAEESRALNITRSFRSFFSRKSGKSSRKSRSSRKRKEELLGCQVDDDEPEIETSISKVLKSGDLEVETNVDDMALAAMSTVSAGTVDVDDEEDGESKDDIEKFEEEDEVRIEDVATIDPTGTKQEPAGSPTSKPSEDSQGLGIFPEMAQNGPVDENELVSSPSKKSIISEKSKELSTNSMTTQEKGSKETPND